MNKFLNEQYNLIKFNPQSIFLIISPWTKKIQEIYLPIYIILNIFYNKYNAMHICGLT